MRELKLTPEQIRRIAAEEAIGYPTPVVAVRARPRRFLRGIGFVAITLFGLHVVGSLLSERPSPAPLQAQAPVAVAEATLGAANIEQLPITRLSAIDLASLTEPLPPAAPETEAESQPALEALTAPPEEEGTPSPDQAISPALSSEPDAIAPLPMSQSGACRAYVTWKPQPGVRPRPRWPAATTYAAGQWKKFGEVRTAPKKKKKGFFLFRAVKAFGQGLAEGVGEVLGPNPPSNRWP